MNDFSSVTLIQAMVFYSDSIFIGLKIVVPVLFVLCIFNLNIKKVDLPALISTSCILMLTGSVLFLLSMATNIFTAWYSNNEAERDLIFNFMTGPNWYQVVVPIFSYGLLPQILWFPKLRTSVYAVFNIVILWFVGSMLVEYLVSLNSSMRPMETSTDWQETGIKAFLFVISFAVLYGKKVSRHPVKA